MSLPEDKEPVYSCEDGLDAARKAVETFYQLKRKAAKKCVWDGPEIRISRILACCLSPEELLSKDNLKYEEENHGRDPLDICLQVTYQLGFQAGWLDRNFEVDSLKNSNDLLRGLLRARKKKVEGEG